MSANGWTIGFRSKSLILLIVSKELIIKKNP